MTESIELLAGDCTVRFEGDEIREERGAVIVLTKPDGTVLVHDRAGYRPAAWLTRAGSVTWHRGDDGVVIEADDGDRRLSIECHAEYASGRYATSGVGVPVGECPACAGVLVHARGAVACLGCGARHGVHRDATVLDRPCVACGLPLIRVERGAVFEVCADRGCDPLADRVRARFDREWSCPTCDGDLRIRDRGGAVATCETPGCGTDFAIPAGVVNGACPACGLPSFETHSGSRCLDPGCQGSPRPVEQAG